VKLTLIAVSLLIIVLLGGCGRLIGAGGAPIPGPTGSGTPSPFGTGIAGGADDTDNVPVTEGPDLTG
jgi:hypothetical protein